MAIHFSLPILVFSALLMPTHAIGAANNATAKTCAALKDLKLHNTQITQAEWQSAQTLPPDAHSAMTGATPRPIAVGVHCLVSGEINHRTGVGGKTYGIQFQLRLPVEWNGKFLFQGGGGTNGFVAPALGSIPSQGSTAIPALLRGYAVVSQNGGHEGLDTSFAQDQQARIDYAYASTGQVTTIAKQLITQLYGQPARQSYFMGCSNGGREAMMAAQRYPTEFEGIVAGNPGFRLTYAGVGEIWDSQQLMNIAPTNEQGQKIVANAYTQQDLDKLSRAILEHCDTKDGLKDGIVNAWEQCSFNPETIQCTTDQTENCLSSPKINTLKAIFEGAKNSQGKNVYASWPYDSGINTLGWRIWKLGTSQTAQSDAINFTLGAKALTDYFMTPYNPSFDPLQFNIDRDLPKLYQTAAIHNADATFLSTFEQRGGKMIIFHGVSDPVFSANDLRDWYLQLQTDMGKDTQQFARLFMIPGMTHCGGGASLDDIDPLTALEQWVEQGIAPDYLLAAGTLPGRTQPQSQPICAYPKIARYQSGDEKSATSFACQ